MKLFIPEIGDMIVLLQDWTFNLYNEDRNHTLMEYMRDPRERQYNDNTPPIPCTIPAGAELKIDRVYIRKGLKEFSSLTFLWKGISVPAKMEETTTWDWQTKKEVKTGHFYKVPKKPVRFWAKLVDVNNIDCNRIS